ncbi:23 kDa integral membrane protein-like [Anthonomus grandis grandis]|uniref:23 kDa integral membrane protein-like n=1 Tax=Anthonomus grandis grandis TaxID=2921223 RepID=UPI002164F1E0|nr:23 kDa integral membrane protein-like [Anthonomus grandis grandis]XP_050296302.1 23 kDa integral membrane protein-like [Anthonomus grandis grandis]
MGCPTECFRFILFVLNLIFAIAGVGLIGGGIGIHLYFKYYKEAVPSAAKAFSNFPIIAGVGGGAIFIIALLGCCGAWKRSVCCLHTYGILLIIIFLACLASTIYTWVLVKDKKGLKIEIEKRLTNYFDKYYTSGETREIVDLIQTSFHCCGLRSPAYWGAKIPESCYPNANRKETCYETGCLGPFQDWIMKSMIFIYFEVALAALELVAGITAICVACSYHDDYMNDLSYDDDESEY